MFLEVRLATQQEAAHIASLAARTFALACPPTAAAADISAFIETSLSAESFAGYIADPERRVEIAALDGDLVGYTMLILAQPVDAVACQLTAAPTAELSKIYVDQTHHGGAVARELLQSAVARARETRSRGVWLGTNEANTRAQRFYEKNGFVRVGNRQFRLGDEWEDDYIYELTFEDAG